MENAGAGRGQTAPESSHRPSFRTPASRFACNTGEAAESPLVAVEDKIFVAVPEELKHGKSNLVWALQNLARDASRSRIVIAHVHVPCCLSEKTGTLLQSFEDVKSTFNVKPRRPWSLEDFSVGSGGSQNSDPSSSPNDGTSNISAVI